MNFNLISPRDNGHDYTIRFKEPIDINANSSIKLNFAELTRNGKIVLREDGLLTLNVSSLDCFPNLIPSTGFANAPLGADGISVKIAKGTYSFKTFEDALASGINTILQGTNRLDYYQSVDVITRDSLGLIGLNLGRDYIGNFNDGDCKFDFTGSPNANAVATSGSTVYENNGGAGGVFDSFAVDFGRHYWHYQNKGLPNFNELNFIQFSGNKRLTPSGGQTGRLILGLYGEEYAVGLGTSPPTRTATGGNTNNIALDGAGFPKNFVNVVIEDYNGDLKIQVAENTTGADYGNPTLWESQGASIDEMRQVWSRPISTIFDSGELPDLTLATYIEQPDYNEETDREVYIRLYKTDEVETGVPLWDSQEAGISFSPQFFVADPSNAENIDYTENNARGVNARNSQIPFNIALFADTVGEGFRDCLFRSIVKDDDAEPATIVKKYTISADRALASAIGFSSVSKDPNVKLADGEEPDVYLSGISLGRVPLDISWRKSSYSIFTDLPLSNYKNVNETTDAGFRKAILANIPTPFNSNDKLIDQATDGDVAEIISSYEPHLPIISEMKNNPIRVNNLKIKIVDMDTEQLASEIIASKINFTIE
jgi:hypothetical protein